MFARFSTLLVPATLAAIAAGLALALPAAPAAAAPDPSQSPLVGSWSGSFVTNLGGFGPISFDISPSGKLRGTATNIPNGITGDLHGQVNKNGFGHVNLKDPPNVVITYNITLSLDGNRNLVGTGVALKGNFTTSFTLSPQ